MKPEEAIKIIKILYILGGRRNGKHRLTEALGTSLEALEKQISERPIGEYEECPRCDNFNIGDSDKYCSECGQKLDWSEE